MKKFLIKYVITVAHAEEKVIKAKDEQMALDIFESLADYEPARLTDNKQLAKILAKHHFGVDIEVDHIEEVTNE